MKVKISAEESVTIEVSDLRVSGEKVSAKVSIMSTLDLGTPTVGRCSIARIGDAWAPDGEWELYDDWYTLDGELEREQNDRAWLDADLRAIGQYYEPREVGAINGIIFAMIVSRLKKTDCK